jgi:hypothetical protein
MDPRIETPLADLQAQDDLIQRVDAELNNIHSTVVRIRSVRDQIEDLIKRSEDQAWASEIEEKGRGLTEKLNALEDNLIQKRVVDGQTVINFPMRLNQFYIYLRGAIDGSDVGPTEGQRIRLADLSKVWQEQNRAFRRLIEEDLAALNGLVRERNIPAIITPTSLWYPELLQTEPRL